MIAKNIFFIVNSLLMDELFVVSFVEASA